MIGKAGKEIDYKCKINNLNNLIVLNSRLPKHNYLNSTGLLRTVLVLRRELEAKYAILKVTSTLKNVKRECQLILKKMTLKQKILYAVCIIHHYVHHASFQPNI